MTKYNLLSQSSCHKNPLKEPHITLLNGERRSFDFAARVADDKTEKRDVLPFFVMDIGRISELMDVWFEHLPRVEPFYSLKCNADPIMLQLLAAHPSVGFNCNSNEDLQKALEYVPAKRVLYSNPCWTRSALLQADEQNVELLCFETDRDLDRILTNHPDAKLLLKICVNPDSEDPNALFGAPLSKASEMLQQSADLGLQCVGISFSVGSDCICPSIYEYAIEWASRLFQFGISMGLKMSILNIGGGFACGFEDWQHAQFTEISNQINKSLDIHFPSNGYGYGLRILATPGRFFAGSVFSLVTNVVGKRSTDASYLTNNNFDAGNTAFLYQINESYYGAFGCRITTNCEPQCAPLFDGGFNSESVYGTIYGLMGFDNADSDIVQPLCHFRQLNIGDWLIWTNMGAYTFDNKGSLEDDDDEFEGFRAPQVFYFSSHENWERVSPTLRATHQEFADTDGLYSSKLGADESDDSCGEQMHSDCDYETDNEMMEEPEGRDNDEMDDFWPFGWSLKFDD